MHNYTVEYLFNGEPRTHTFELKQPELPVRTCSSCIGGMPRMAWSCPLRTRRRRRF